MRRNSFLAAKRHGVRIEERFRLLLRRAGVVNRGSKRGSHSGYDILYWLHGRVQKAEVKADLEAAHSGNLAIEYHNPIQNRPSGLTITTSDLWVVSPGNDTLWACPTSLLRQYVADNPAPRHILRAGDGNASLLLFPCSTLLGNLFCRLDNQSPLLIRRYLLSVPSSEGCLSYEKWYHVLRTREQHGTRGF